MGLWGTADQDRVAVSSNENNPNGILGYVRLNNGGYWTIEGDEQNRHYGSPHEAACAGIELWNGGVAANEADTDTANII